MIRLLIYIFSIFSYSEKSELLMASDIACFPGDNDVDYSKPCLATLFFNNSQIPRKKDSKLEISVQTNFDKQRYLD